MKLFVFYLGGRAKGCKLELHDVAFCIGDSVEDCCPAIREQWFGEPKGLHMDAYAALDFADGHQIRVLSNLFPDDSVLSQDLKLYFINLGGYDPAQFTEFHPSGFYVASTIEEAKQRARQSLTTPLVSMHTDDAYEVDDCLEISQYIPNYRLVLEPTLAALPIIYTCGFNRVP